MDVGQWLRREALNKNRTVPWPFPCCELASFSFLKPPDGRTIQDIMTADDPSDNEQNPPEEAEADEVCTGGFQ